MHIQRGKLSLIHLSVLVIALSFDVSKNPSPEFPCGHCDLEGQWDQNGVCCDDTQTWYHTNCQNINSVVYETIGSSNCSWICLKCGMPKFSSSYFEQSTTPLSMQNSFNVLDDSSIHAPKATSFPSKVTSPLPLTYPLAQTDEVSVVLSKQHHPADSKCQLQISCK